MHYATVFLSSVTTIAWKQLESVLAILEGKLVLSLSLSSSKVFERL